MVMKITFEADTKGFEQVSRVLEQQQKLLNENAAAAERLAKAQAGIGRGAAGSTQNESLNYFRQTAQSLKDVTGALQQLNQSQGGFQSFFNMFTGFRKELSEAATEQKTGVFSILSSQIDGLKKNLAASSTSIRSIKEEVKDLERSSAKDPTNVGLKNQLTDARGFLSEQMQQMLRESFLLSQAKTIQMMQQPIGTTMAGMFGGGGGGFFGGMMGMGPSPAGIGRFLGGASLAYGATRMGSALLDNVTRGQDLSLNRLYFERMSEYDAAQSGALGAAVFRGRGLGAFGDQVGGYLLGGRTTGQRISNFIAGGINELGVLATQFRFTTAEEDLAFYQDRAKQIEAANIDAYSRTSQATLQNIKSPEMVRYAAQYGYAGARNMQSHLAIRQIGLQEASPFLRMAAEFGINEEQIIRKAPKSLLTTEELGISNQARKEAYRRAAFLGRPEAGMSELEVALGRAQELGIDVRSNFMLREQVGDVLSNIQSQYQASPISAEQAGGRFFANLQQGTGLPVNIRMQAAMDATSIATERLSTPGSAENRGMRNLMMRYNIPPAMAQVLMEQLAKGGKSGDVYKFIAANFGGGKTPTDIQKEFQGISEQTQKARNVLLGLDRPEVRALNEKLQAAGLGNVAAASMTGSALGALNAPGAFDVDKGINMFGSAAEGTTGTKISLGDLKSQYRQVRGAELTQQETLLQGFETISKASGRTIGEELSKVFLDMTDEVIQKINQTSNEIKNKFEADKTGAPPSNLNQPVNKPGERNRPYPNTPSAGR